MQNDKPRPFANLSLGGVFVLFAWGWGSFVGDHTQFLSLFFYFIGSMLLFGGYVDILRGRDQRKKREQAQIPSGVHGTAAFATLEQCHKAGLTDPHGLFLGTLDGTPLFYKGKAHLLTVAPARKGKGVCAVIPNLMHYQGSVFVTDPKGELAAVTRKHRRDTFKQNVYVINPWGLHGLPQHRYNPLQGLIDAADDPRRRSGMMDQARAIALQLLPEPEDARNKFFRDGSRTMLIGLMLHLATRGDPKTCTLTEMWKILGNAKRLKETLAVMAGSRELADTISTIGENLVETESKNPEQFGSFRVGAAEAVAIFDPLGDLGRAVSASDFRFEDLKGRKTSIYLVIPADDRITANASWLGLLTRQAVTAVARSASKVPVLFMLDEFANMGKLAGLTETLTALPGLGVRVWVFVQELADIKRVYGEHTHTTLLSQAEVKQFFAVQSPALAKELSDSLGQKTVKAKSDNLGKDATDEIGETLSEIGRPLIAPEDIRQMGSAEQILVIETLPPIRAKRIPVWDVAPWQDQVQPNPVEGDYRKPLPKVKLRYDPATEIGYV